jgi:hypothetical protein
MPQGSSFLSNPCTEPDFRRQDEVEAPLLIRRCGIQAANNGRHGRS